jgi:molecular chaperone GrpE
MKNTETETEKQTDASPADPATEPLATLDVETITPEQLAELKQKAVKGDEHWERLLRLTADFENYKKRATREKQDSIKYANENLLQKLVPVLDNFDMALSATQTAQGDAVQSLQTGINMIHQQLKSALLESGLEEVESDGKPFDPNLHEAVSQKETTEAPEGQVVQQLRKGYRFRDRLLRPATVIVAKHPAAS